MFTGKAVQPFGQAREGDWDRSRAGELGRVAAEWESVKTVGSVSWGLFILIGKH